MIRVNNQYLDLSPDTFVAVERQVKLFEQLDKTMHDFSYDFEFPRTTKNLSILGFPLADVASKTIYNELPCDIIGTDGRPIYSGKLRIEKINGRKITASFFSGNYNWFNLITGNLSDLDWSEYDIILSDTNIIANRLNTSGVVFPLVDMGGLITRSTTKMKAADFTGALYVKDIFNKVLYRAGVKYNGDLANDWLFNNIVVLKDSNSLEVEASSCFVQKTSTTNQPTELVDYKNTWQNDSTRPYFDGANNAFDLANSRYVAPYKMTVEVECTLRASLTDVNYSNRIHLYINGVYTFVDIGLAAGGLYNSATPGDQEFFTIKRVIDLESGDILEIYSHWQESTGSTTPVNILSGKLRITPIFIHQIFGSNLVPQWTKKDFILSILNLFNVISDFDPISKTVTFNLFEKLKTKEAIDISKYVDPSTIELDFSEFISSYGRKNYLTYTEGDDEDLKEYNIKEFVKYGAGTIEVDNDFIEGEKTIIESKFTSPVSYFNNVFTASLERLNLIEMEETSNAEFSAVAAGVTYAKFTIPDDYYLVGNLVRIKDSTFPDYNGDWKVTAITAGFVELNVPYQGVTATGKISKLNHRYINNDNIFLLVHVPDQNVANFSESASFDIDNTNTAVISFAYFNLLNTGDTINGYKQGLSFGAVDNELSYQRNLIDTYWRSVGSILSDPVKLKAKFYFPNSVFRSLTPLTPVYLKTRDTVNMYYINRITGYTSGKEPCEVELIKLG